MHQEDFKSEFGDVPVPVPATFHSNILLAIQEPISTELKQAFGLLETPITFDAPTCEKIKSGVEEFLMLTLPSMIESLDDSFKRCPGNVKLTLKNQSIIFAQEIPVDAKLKMEQLVHLQTLVFEFPNSS